MVENRVKNSRYVLVRILRITTTKKKLKTLRNVKSDDDDNDEMMVKTRPVTVRDTRDIHVELQLELTHRTATQQKETAHIIKLKSSTSQSHLHTTYSSSKKIPI